MGADAIQQQWVSNEQRTGMNDQARSHPISLWQLLVAFSLRMAAGARASTVNPRLRLLYWKCPWSINTRAGCSSAAARIDSLAEDDVFRANTRAHAMTAGMNTACYPAPASAV